MRTNYIQCKMYVLRGIPLTYSVHPHLAMYFGSSFGRYLTFHTRTSVRRKKLSVYLKSDAAFSCCSEVL